MSVVALLTEHAEAQLAEESIALLTAFERVEMDHLVPAINEWRAMLNSDLVFVESAHGLWTLSKNRYGETGAVFDSDAKRDFLLAKAREWLALPSSWRRPIHLLEISYRAKDR